jgi:hypothetical protein
MSSERRATTNQATGHLFTASTKSQDLPLPSQYLFGRSAPRLAPNPQSRHCYWIKQRNTPPLRTPGMMFHSPFAWISPLSNSAKIRLAPLFISDLTPQTLSQQFSARESLRSSILLIDGLISHLQLGSTSAILFPGIILTLSLNPPLGALSLGPTEASEIWIVI